jgi:putative peptide zinc metalloprotease protein
MMVMYRRVLLLAVVASLAVLIGTASTADAKPKSRAVVNQAVAVDTKTGRTTNRVAWMFRDNVGGALPSNYAKAQTWCNDCHSTAIAVQIVLMSNVVGPTAAWNHSVAANGQCARCSTAAAAFQFSVISGRRVSLSAAGAAQLASLHSAMDEISSSGAPAAEVNAAAAGVAVQILGVLQREVQTAGLPGNALGFMSQSVQDFQIRYQHDLETG